MGEARVRSAATFEEFLAHYRDEDLWAEWVHGEVVVMSPASARHQIMVWFLAQLLSLYVEVHTLGRVLLAPFLMRLGPDVAREPDILFVRQENLARLKETHLDGPADLVVEVVSPESRLRDRGTKFAEYEMAGVPEYWLIDPDLQRADFYMLAPDGRYERRPTDDRGWYTATVLPGFRLYVPWLWQDPLPPILDVLREMGLV